MKKINRFKKGKFYKSTYPGCTAIILCTGPGVVENCFSGVGVHKGNNVNIGDVSDFWNMNEFEPCEKMFVFERIETPTINLLNFINGKLIASQYPKMDNSHKLDVPELKKHIVRLANQMLLDQKVIAKNTRHKAIDEFLDKCQSHQIENSPFISDVQHALMNIKFDDVKPTKRNEIL